MVVAQAGTPRPTRLSGRSRISLLQIAERYHDRRGFLVGDAAHWMTPRGGTGINTAIQDRLRRRLEARVDAAGLGWARTAWYLRSRATSSLYNVRRAGDPDGDGGDADDALPWDLNGGVAHHWVRRGNETVSTLDLLGDGLTLLAGSEGPRWTRAVNSFATRVPLVTHTLDESATSSRARGWRCNPPATRRPPAPPLPLHHPVADRRAPRPVAGHDPALEGGQARGYWDAFSGTALRWRCANRTEVPALPVVILCIVRSAITTARPRSDLSPPISFPRSRPMVSVRLFDVGGQIIRFCWSCSLGGRTAPAAPLQRPVRGGGGGPGRAIAAVEGQVGRARSALSRVSGDDGDVAASYDWLERGEYLLTRGARVHPGERAELGQRPRHPGPIPRRLNMPEDLVERPPTQLVLTADLALRDPLNEHLASDLRPQLHVCVHPSPVRSPNPSEEASGSPHEPTGIVRCCRFRRSQAHHRVLSFSKSVCRG